MTGIILYLKKFFIYTSVIFISCITVNVLLKKEVYKYNFKYTYKNIEARELWAYFAEFSNHMKINPTMFAYEILNSSKYTDPNEGTDKYSNFGSYKYSVLYKEHLVYLPFLTNEAIGNYLIISEQSTNSAGLFKGQNSAIVSNSGYFRIISNHTTYQNGLSFNTVDEMFFMPGKEKGTTNLRQSIQYECQRLFAFYCRWEFLGQRNLIHNELRKEFQFEIELN